MATKKAATKTAEPKAVTASYLEIYALKNDPDFRNRIGMSLVNYATYLLGADPNRPFHEQEINWSRKASSNTDDQIYRIMGFVLGDPLVQEKLAGILDSELQVIVEYAVNNNLAVLL
jgi:hypothetical protein